MNSAKLFILVAYCTGVIPNRMDYFQKLESLNKAVESLNKTAFMAVYMDFAILSQDSYLGLM